MPAPSDRLPNDLMKALMPAEQYAAWQRQQETSKEFWRTLNGPAQRPLDSNADEWHLFVDENKDSAAYLAVQIAEAIDDARRSERERCAMLHESVNPASDDERLHPWPGAGAMGAVIEYRDLIRSTE